jgi:protein ImuB
MTMRVCAVSLPDLRVELVRALDATTLPGPVAIVVAEPPMTETKLLGNTRIDVVSREACALGVQPGQTIAQARARAGDLSVRVVRPEAVRDVLAGLAEVGLAFGATVSFGVAHAYQGDFGDVVWIDVTGCAHLHSRDSREGEALLASRLAGAMTSLGHVCSVAIADGPRVSAMLARAAAGDMSARSAWRREATLLLDPVVVPPGRNAAAIAPLPVASLPLGADDVRWLAKIGVRTIEDLRALPRDGLSTRLGAAARDVIMLAEGDDRAPLAPYVPPEIPEEETELEYGIEGTQALTFVAKTLTDRLAARLAGRAVAAARVELVLRLDPAIVRDRARERDEPPCEANVVLDLPAALSNASDLLAALRPKIERLVLIAPVLRARLRAPVLVPKRAAALSLFDPQPKADRALPRLIAELVSDLGSDAVSMMALGDSWVPEERSKLVPYGTPPIATKRKRLISNVPEPTRLLPEPRVVARDAIHVTRHLSRIESVEWWKVPPDKPLEARERQPVDYVQAWTDEGAAWVEIDRAKNVARIRGYFD